MPSTFRAFIWEAGVWADLNTAIPPGSGWTLNVAKGINSAGQIVGAGIIGGVQHAYLLTPGAPTTTSTSVTTTSSTTTTTVPTGFVPPDNATRHCEDAVWKNLARLTKCLVKCNQKAVAAGVAGHPFDEAACKSNPSGSSCRARYNAASASLLAGGTCPACQGPASQSTLADQLATDVDAKVPGVYCAGTVPLP
jgi:probable HAF family extracellular repeat protein